jgi:hypothetical protein
MDKELMVEAVSAAMEEFAEAATTTAIVKTLQDTGYVTLEEAELIKSLVDQVVLESAEDFVPTEEMLVEAGYVEGAEGEVVTEGAEGAEGEVIAEGAEGEVVTESQTLAERIAAKIDIL